MVAFNRYDPFEIIADKSLYVKIKLYDKKFSAHLLIS